MKHRYKDNHGKAIDEEKQDAFRSKRLDAIIMM